MKKPRPWRNVARWWPPGSAGPAGSASRRAPGPATREAGPPRFLSCASVGQYGFRCYVPSGFRRGLRIARTLVRAACGAAARLVIMMLTYVDALRHPHESFPQPPMSHACSLRLRLAAEGRTHVLVAVTRSIPCVHHCTA